MNLKEAAQQALEYLEQHAIISGIPIRDALRAALEPVTTCHELSKGGDKLSLPFNHFPDAGKMVATINEMETVEPVAWSYTDAKGRAVVVIANTAPYEDAKPLYSAPPKRKPISTDMILATWVEECIPKRSTPELVVAFARAIERAHGIGGKSE